MKSLPKVAGALILALVGTLASGAAMAEHWGHGWGHGHGYRGGVRFGISLGVPIYGPAYYPAPYYGYPVYPYPAQIYAYPPLVVEPSPPPVYIEQGTEAQQPADWYYCAASRAYYPYVSECASGWQRVPAQPAAR